METRTTPAAVRLDVLGCSGSFPGPHSPASGYLLRAEHEGRVWAVVLDLGNGTLGPLQRLLDPRTLDAVLITHLHPDHCADLCGLHVMQTYDPRGRRPPIALWGPAGTAERLSLMYEGATDKDFAASFTLGELRDRDPVRIGPFHVVPYAVNHPVPAFGFRVEVHGRVVAYTGDTDACDALTPLLADADLALVECAFVDGRDTVPDIHLSGSRAAQAALTAGGVGRLVLTHLPAWNDPDVCRAQAEAVWGAPVELAEPAGRYDL